MTEKQVLLDTNFFLVPYQLGIYIFSELDRIVPTDYTLITLRPLFEELKKLSKEAKGGDKTAATLGLEFAKGIKVIDSSLNGDDAIIEYAKRNKCIVCTNDSELRKRLKQQKTPTIFARGKQKLEMG